MAGIAPAMAEEEVPNRSTIVVDKALDAMVADSVESNELSPTTVEEVPSVTVVDPADVTELLGSTAPSTVVEEKALVVTDMLDGDELAPIMVEDSLDVAESLNSDELAPAIVEEAPEVAEMLEGDEPSPTVFEELLDMAELLGSNEPSPPVLVDPDG